MSSWSWCTPNLQCGGKICQLNRSQNGHLPKLKSSSKTQLDVVWWHNGLESATDSPPLPHHVKKEWQSLPWHFGGIRMLNLAHVQLIGWVNMILQHCSMCSLLGLKCRVTLKALQLEIGYFGNPLEEDARKYSLWLHQTGLHLLGMPPSIQFPFS